MSTKANYTIFTAEGVTFEGTGTTLARALTRAAVPKEYTVVAVIESESVVQPTSGKLTALVVRHTSGRPPGSVSGGRSRDSANRAGAKGAIAMSTPAVVQNAPTPRCKARANASAKQKTTQTPAEDVAGRTAQSNQSVGLDVEAWVPKTQSAFRINQIAEFLSCTAQHIFNLVNAGEIQVPAENIARAASRPGIMVPRESLVAFLRARSTSNPVWRKNRIAKKKATAGNATGAVSAKAKAKGRRTKAS